MSGKWSTCAWNGVFGNGFIPEYNWLANCLYGTAKEHLPGHKIRTDYADGDPDFEAPFYLLKYTYAAAVLTENGFMDS